MTVVTNQQVTRKLVKSYQIQCYYALVDEVGEKSMYHAQTRLSGCGHDCKKRTLTRLGQSYDRRWL